ncbi:hypothetical protein J7F03_31105 [Streptomyces sp. ISL-43]|uniref:hypothetical protein n=1 Tax=Streptomyces sp. ISL-43 TaxID=2819183 RepID=UPI001BEC71E6|nr:hypothetical protein [Streptomyces sp. ISL-43]MBT2451435.1 hypothetical protein [Streptomyces sp. ISL-43]
MNALRPPRTVLCSYCKAAPSADAARTLAAREGSWTVTWHARTCPHYIADRILTGKES